MYTLPPHSSRYIPATRGVHRFALGGRPAGMTSCIAAVASPLCGVRLRAPCSRQLRQPYAVPRQLCAGRRLERLWCPRVAVGRSVGEAEARDMYGVRRRSVRHTSVCLSLAAFLQSWCFFGAAARHASHRVVRGQPKASGRKGGAQEQGAGHSSAYGHGGGSCCCASHHTGRKPNRHDRAGSSCESCQTAGRRAAESVRKAVEGADKAPEQGAGDRSGSASGRGGGDRWCRRRRCRAFRDQRQCRAFSDDRRWLLRACRSRARARRLRQLWKLRQLRQQLRRRHR